MGYIVLVTVSVPFTDSGSVTASESSLTFQSPAFTLDAGGSVDDVSGGTIGFTDETLTLGPGASTGNSLTITSGAITGMASTGSGELDLAGSLTLAGTNVWDGTLDGSQAALNLTSGSLSLSGTASIGTLGVGGSGAVNLSGTASIGTLNLSGDGTLNLSGTASIGTAQIGAYYQSGDATLADTGSLEVTNSLSLVNSSLPGSGQLVIAATAYAEFDSPVSLDGLRLINYGTFDLRIPGSRQPGHGRERRDFQRGLGRIPDQHGRQRFVHQRGRLHGARELECRRNGERRLQRYRQRRWRGG